RCFMVPFRAQLSIPGVELSHAQACPGANSLRISKSRSLELMIHHLVAGKNLFFLGHFGTIWDISRHLARTPRAILLQKSTIRFKKCKGKKQISDVPAFVDQETCEGPESRRGRGHGLGRGSNSRQPEHEPYGASAYCRPCVRRRQYGWRVTSPKQ